jgi:membrane protease YdiL (CAAX protease family)
MRRMPADRDKVPFASMAPFLLISFGLAWGILALFIFLPGQMTRIFGQISGRHPLFFLCVYSPAIAAFVIVARHGGSRGVRRFLSRMLIWRCPPAWYIFIFVGIPLVFYAGAALNGNIFREPFPFSSFGPLLTALALAAVKGPVEEFGWRGVALPLLQRKLAPIWAGLILGAIWGVWHLPAFLLSGTQQSEWSFLPFLFGCIAISVIATALFNASRGSILLSALFHFSLMNPVFPDAQPYDTYILIIIAVIVVWLYRTNMFAGVGAVMEVIPRGDSTRPDDASGATF